MQPCKKSIAIFLDEEEYRISSQSKVSKNGKALILPFSNKVVTITQRADYTFVEIYGGKLVVKFNGIQSFYITLSEEYRNGTCGLCGNYNEISGDDLDTKSPELFGDSWQKPQAGEICQQTLPLDNECDRSEINLLSGCDNLLNIAFKECILKLNKSHFLDTCAKLICNKNLSDEDLCEIHQQLARTCIQNEIHVDWRNPKFCREFMQLLYHYNTC